MQVGHHCARQPC